MLARHFKAIEKLTLYLAFFINVILLFHRIDIHNTRDKDDEDTGVFCSKLAFFSPVIFTVIMLL